MIYMFKFARKLFSTLNFILHASIKLIQLIQFCYNAVQAKYYVFTNLLKLFNNECLLVLCKILSLQKH